MPQTLLEYADWLDERGVLWPAPPRCIRPRATPYLAPLDGVRAVTWSIYGTLITIDEGRLLHLHPNPLCMEVALEKTIHEFNMWNSMSRKPGAPWEYMLTQYARLVDRQKMAAGRVPRAAPEIDSAVIWQTILERLTRKDYTWDEGFYGDLEALSRKVAWFFHASLQGHAAAPNALAALKHVQSASCEQGLVGDAQCFTLVQLARALRSAGSSARLSKLVSSGCISLSVEVGARHPAEALFKPVLLYLAKSGIMPGECLHVAASLREELAVARGLGLRTALYAGDASSLRASAADVKDPALRPDRILTDLRQIRQIVRQEA
jgi:FMN phosphatase YigB (HAD superfamily)